MITIVRRLKTEMSASLCRPMPNVGAKLLQSRPGSAALEKFTATPPWLGPPERCNVPRTPGGPQRSSWERQRALCRANRELVLATVQ
jgi:hypothetical protein